MVVNDADDAHLVEMARVGGFDVEEEEFSHIASSIEKDLGAVGIGLGHVAVKGVDDAFTKECAETAGKDQKNPGEGKGHRLPLNGEIGLVANDDIYRGGHERADVEPEGQRQEIPKSGPTPEPDLGFSRIEEKETRCEGNGGGGNEGAFCKAGFIEEWKASLIVEDVGKGDSDENGRHIVEGQNKAFQPGAGRAFEDEFENLAADF